MSTSAVPSTFVVHRDEIEDIHIHGGHRAELRQQTIEFPGEAPLWIARTCLPDGPVRPRIVLIHGFAQNRFSWHTEFRTLSGWLAERGWDVWNLELRGHGRSRRRGGSRTTEFADYPADLNRLADALGEPAFWIGHSLGASVAYAAAAARPTAPATAGVIGIGGLYRFGQAGWVLPAACRITNRLPVGLNLGDIQVHTGISGSILARLFPLVDLAAFGMPISGWWPGSVEPELAKERMERGFDFIPVRVWQEMASWGSADSVPWDDGWRKSTAPCLIIVGDRDSMLYPEEGQAAYDRSGSDDKMFKMFDDRDGLTHWGHLDLVLGHRAPEHVWSLIDSWMGERIQ